MLWGVFWYCHQIYPLNPVRKWNQFSPQTLLKRNALPVAPVNRVEMSSERLVRIVSQFAQENRRVPPIWSRKILPIFIAEALKTWEQIKKRTRNTLWFFNLLGSTWWCHREPFIYTYMISSYNTWNHFNTWNSWLWMKESKVHTWTKHTGKLKLRTLQKQQVKEVNILTRKAKEYPFSFDMKKTRRQCAISNQMMRNTSREVRKKV